MTGKQHDIAALKRLAHACGVQTSYNAMDGTRRQASEESLRAVLAALEMPLDRGQDAADLLREQMLEPWRRGLEPVNVAWDGAGWINFYSAPETQNLPVTIEILADDGLITGAAPVPLSTTLQPDEIKTVRCETIDGRDYLVKTIPLPELPLGYYTARLECGPMLAESMIIAAPRHAYEPPGSDDLWGVFMPLYAMQSQTSWGAGDLGDFGRLVDWVQDQGGGIVATLPLLAAFLDEPFDPSPYVPASRLFWNEFYIDIAGLPELERSAAAREMIESDAVRAAIGELRVAPVVDYRALADLKRRVLDVLVGEFFGRRGQQGPRDEGYDKFLRDNPKAGDYAAFRAACNHYHGAWRAWPEPARSGGLSATDYDEAVKQYFLYTQFVVQEQLDALSEKARRAGPGLYLDLPLGVHPDSYDVWRERDSFAWGVSGGAPPDPFFSKGQDWGFAPLHPRKMRQRRYSYIIECLRRLMRQAGVVRIDHVMGLHRLFWVPNGMEATQGVYVEYPAEELHAILNLESRRHHSAIVGEDLGTVPDEVRRAMHRHNVHGMYVMQFCIQPKGHDLVSPVGHGTVASFNTHDMPSFAGFWQGRDIDDQIDLGLLTPAAELEAREYRTAILSALVRFLEGKGLLPPNSGEDAAELPSLALLRAALEHLGRSPAKMVLVNLEDLWQELRQQNVPGTCEERQNWRHKARHSLEEFTALSEVRELLAALDRARK